MNIPSIKQFDIKHKRVLIRVDFNVPMDDHGHITHDVRIQEALPTINYALSQNASVILVSHFGRPQEGQFDKALSLSPIADHLTSLLKREVHFIETIQPKAFFEPGQVYLLENIRFLKGEKSNDPILAQSLSQMCDLFVMDAFSVAHRAQASTVGVALKSEQACAGIALDAQLQALKKALSHPDHPLVAIVGGSKVSTKFKVLEKLLDKVDVLILGGGMANTFLKAQGHDIAASLYEEDWCPKAQELIQKAQGLNKALVLPLDVVCAQELKEDATVNSCGLDGLRAEDKILDIGPRTVEVIAPYIEKAKTIVWNGPVGVFEVKPFAQGTMAIAELVAKSQAYSIAGGGDTLAAIEKAGVGKAIDYQSTAGGAFLEYLEGVSLPGLEALKTRAVPA